MPAKFSRYMVASSYLALFLGFFEAFLLTTCGKGIRLRVWYKKLMRKYFVYGNENCDVLSENLALPANIEFELGNFIRTGCLPANVRLLQQRVTGGLHCIILNYEPGSATIKMI